MENLEWGHRYFDWFVSQETMTRLHQKKLKREQTKIQYERVIGNHYGRFKTISQL